MTGSLILALVKRLIQFCENLTRDVCGNLKMWEKIISPYHLEWSFLWEIGWKWFIWIEKKEKIKRAEKLREHYLFTEINGQTNDWIKYANSLKCWMWK